MDCCWGLPSVSQTLRSHQLQHLLVPQARHCQILLVLQTLGQVALPCGRHLLVPQSCCLLLAPQSCCLLLVPQSCCLLLVLQSCCLLLAPLSCYLVVPHSCYVPILPQSCCLLPVPQSAGLRHLCVPFHLDHRPLLFDYRLKIRIRKFCDLFLRSYRCTSIWKKTYKMYRMFLELYRTVFFF